jgi:hypothetical protein
MHTQQTIYFQYKQARNHDTIDNEITILIHDEDDSSLLLGLSGDLILISHHRFSLFLCHDSVLLLVCLSLSILLFQRLVQLNQELLQLSKANSEERIAVTIKQAVRGGKCKQLTPS